MQQVLQTVHVSPVAHTCVGANVGTAVGAPVGRASVGAEGEGVGIRVGDTVGWQESSAHLLHSS